MAGREGGAVVGTVFVSGRAGPSSSLSTAITDPKPTRNAATHASGITTARPPIREKRERRPSSSSAASIASRWASSCRRRAPSVSGCAAGAVGAPSASRWAAGAVASSTSGTPLALISEVVTIGRASATDSFTRPNRQGYFVERSEPRTARNHPRHRLSREVQYCRSSGPATGVFLARSRPTTSRRPQRTHMAGSVRGSADTWRVVLCGSKSTTLSLLITSSMSSRSWLASGTVALDGSRARRLGE